jgi:hypothetical protein
MVGGRGAVFVVAGDAPWQENATNDKKDDEEDDERDDAGTFQHQV